MSFLEEGWAPEIKRKAFEKSGMLLQINLSFKARVCLDACDGVCSFLWKDCLYEEFYVLKQMSLFIFVPIILDEGVFVFSLRQWLEISFNFFY